MYHYTNSRTPFPALSPGFIYFGEKVRIFSSYYRVPRQHAHYGSLCIGYIGAGGTGVWPASYATAAATGVGTSPSMKPPVAMKARSSQPPQDCNLDDISSYNMDAVSLRRLTDNSLRKLCAQVLALPRVVPSSPAVCGVLQFHLSMYSSCVCFCARCHEDRKLWNPVVLIRPESILCIMFWSVDAN